MREPPLKIKCPECGDTGWIKCKIGKIPCKCENAKWNYLTPEQWEAETGDKLAEDRAVWVDFYNGWHIIEYGRLPLKTIPGAYKIVVYREGQPKPPEDWKP